MFEHFSELVDWMNFIWHPKGTLQIGRLKSSKNSWYYVDITMAPIDSCFIIFCSPGTPTHSLLWSIHSCQNRMSNITRPYHCGLSCVFRRDYVLKFYADQLMILRSGCHVTQKYLQHRNTKSLKVSQKVKFISSIIHISFRFLLVFASIYTDLPLRLKKKKKRKNTNSYYSLKFGKKSIHDK